MKAEITVYFMVESDSLEDAEKCLSAALGNMISSGSDIKAFELENVEEVG